MLAALNSKKNRVKYLQAVKDRADKLASKYNTITFWLDKEIKRYIAFEIFEWGLLKNCGWTLRLYTDGDSVYLDGRITPELSRMYPGDWHYGIDYGDLRLSIDDDEVFLSGPIDAMREYISKHKLEVDIQKLNDTIDKREVELSALVRLRDQFQEKGE